MRCDVDVKSMEENTPLHLACFGNDKETVQSLLDKNAEVNLKNIFCKTEKDLTTSKEVSTTHFSFLLYVDFFLFFSKIL